MNKACHCINVDRVMVLLTGVVSFTNPPSEWDPPENNVSPSFNPRTRG